MRKYKISLNQLAEFSGASDASKKRIIRQQLNPDPFRVPRYALTKARIRKSLSLKGDLDPIREAIQILQQRKVTTDWQINDKKVSLEALTRFIKIKIPSIFKKVEFEVIRPQTSVIELKEVDVIVAPEVVIRGKHEGQSVLGGVKIHISKTKPFDLERSRYVAAIVYKYLKEEVAEKGDVVLPELCFCIDVFNEKLVKAPSNSDEVISILKNVCDEIKRLWDQNS